MLEKLRPEAKDKFMSACFSKHRPSGSMLSISQNVHLSVCLSICVFTFEVPLKRSGLKLPRKKNIFLLILPYKTWWKPHFPMDSISQDLFEFLRFECFFLSVFQKNWVLGYSWSTQKPRFPMDKRPLVKGRITNFSIFLDVFEFLRFG